MQYNETQIEIIKRFGKKELTEGCIITATINGYSFDYHISGNGVFNGTKIAVIPRNFVCSFSSWADIEKQIISTDCCGDVKFEILGNIPHLEDVFRVAEEKCYTITVRQDYNLQMEVEMCEDGVEYIQYNPTLPLLSQSESTLQELLSLFPNQ